MDDINDPKEKVHLYFNIYQELLRGKTLSEEGKAIIYKDLTHETHEVALTAATLYASLPTKDLDILFENFNSFSDAVKKILLTHFCGHFYYKSHKFIFERIEKLEDSHEVLLHAAQCLGHTDYPILPYMLNYLPNVTHASSQYLKIALKLMNKDALKPHLALFPKIPAEHIFREAFGDKYVDEIKS